jgi:hypothetical protein
MHGQGPKATSGNPAVEPPNADKDLAAGVGFPPPFLLHQDQSMQDQFKARMG